MTDVVVVDDHALVAETVKLALIGTGLDVRTVVPGELSLLLAELCEIRPSLVLLDLSLGGYGASTPLIAPLVRNGIRVLVVTGVEERVPIAEALEQGALGYQSKTGGLDALLAKTAEALSCTTAALDLAERFALLDDLARHRETRERELAPFQRLTDREQHTLRELAQGRSVHHIAQAWVVSEATVRTHVRGVLSKLGAPSQLAAVAIAITGGWLEAAPMPTSQLPRISTTARPRSGS